MTSCLHVKRKFLTPKFWSLGTYLGYLGPLSQKVQGEIFSKPQFWFILTPNNFPALVASFVFEKNLKTLPTWRAYLCDQVFQSFSISYLSGSEI